jgi:hypothetical protein
MGRLFLPLFIVSNFISVGEALKYLGLILQSRYRLATRDFSRYPCPHGSGKDPIGRASCERTF